MRLELLRNLSWLAASSVLVRPIWFVFITYVCIQTIGAEQYGTMAALLALVSIVDGTMLMGTGSLVIRDVARDRDRSSEYFSNYLVARAVLSGLGIVVAYLIAAALGHAAIWHTVLAASAYVVCRSMVNFCRHFFEAYEAFKQVAFSTVLEKIFVVACGSLALFFHPSATSVLLGMSAGMLVTAAVNVRWVHKGFARYVRNLFSLEFLKGTLPVALPLGLSSLFILLFMRTDSVMIEYFVGELETAQYALAFRVLEALIILPALLVSVLLPRLAVLRDEKDPRFDSLSFKGGLLMLVGGSLVAVAVYLLSPVFLPLIDDSAEMAPAVSLLQVLIWSFPLSALNYLMSTALTASDRQNVMAIVLGGAAVFNLGFNLFLIPEYGASGAAVATIGTQVVVTLLFGFILRSDRQERGRSENIAST